MQFQHHWDFAHDFEDFIISIGNEVQENYAS